MLWMLMLGKELINLKETKENLEQALKEVMLK